jgi:hypothetical protein
MALVDARKRFLSRAIATYNVAKEKDTPEQLAQRMSFLNPFDKKMVQLTSLRQSPKKK